MRAYYSVDTSSLLSLLLLLKACGLAILFSLLKTTHDEKSMATR